MLRRAEEEDKQKGEESEKLAAVQTPAVPTGSNSGSRSPSPPVRLIPPAHTQPNTGEENRKILTLPRLFRCRESGINAAVYPQLSPLRAHAGRQDSLKPRTSSSAPEALRSCARSPVPAPVLHFTFVGSFPFGYPPPWLVSDQTITFQRVLNNEKKKVGFPFFGPPEDPPLGMTLPSLTAERTPFPAHRSRLPPPHPPAGGQDSVQAAAPRSARPSFQTL